jgi:hypothetical protein
MNPSSQILYRYVHRPSVLSLFFFWPHLPAFYCTRYFVPVSGTVYCDHFVLNNVRGRNMEEVRSASETNAEIAAQASFKLYP